LKERIKGRDNSDIKEGTLYSRFAYVKDHATSYSLFLTILGNPSFAEIFSHKYPTPLTTRIAEYDGKTENPDLAAEDNEDLESIRLEIPIQNGRAMVGGSSDGSALSFLSIAFLGAVTVAASLCRRG
jgi:hypothetical protein